MSAAGGNCWEELRGACRLRLASHQAGGAWPGLGLQPACSWSGSMVVLLAGGESKYQKYKNHEDGGKVDAGEWIIDVDCNGRGGSGAGDDNCYCHQSPKSRFCFDLEVKFHGRQQQR